MSNIDPEGIVILARALDGISDSLDLVAEAIRNKEQGYIANDGLEAIATSIRESAP